MNKKNFIMILLPSVGLFSSFLLLSNLLISNNRKFPLLFVALLCFVVNGANLYLEILKNKRY